MLKVGILGASGYTGAELVRLVVSTRSSSWPGWVPGKTPASSWRACCPRPRGIAGLGDRRIEAFEPERAGSSRTRLDVMFTALPHAASARAGAALYAAGLIVVDLSADFRLRDAGDLRRVVRRAPGAGAAERGGVRPSPSCTATSLRARGSIAAPGCYPTSAVLALAPLLARGPGGAGRHRDRLQERRQRSGQESDRGHPPTRSRRGDPRLQGRRQPPPPAGNRAGAVPRSRRAGGPRGLHAAPGAHDSRDPDHRVRPAQLRRQRGRVPQLPRGSASARDWSRCSKKGQLPDTLHVRGSARAHVAYAEDVRTGTLRRAVRHRQSGARSVGPGRPGAQRRHGLVRRAGTSRGRPISVTASAGCRAGPT